MCNYHFSPGDVAGQLTAPHTCPGQNFTFTCNVTGNRSDFTSWRVNGSYDSTLPHRSNTTVIFGPNKEFTAKAGTGFGRNATSFMSTLSGPAWVGTLVECFGPPKDLDPWNLVGNSTLQIIGECVKFLFLIIYILLCSG